MSKARAHESLARDELRDAGNLLQVSQGTPLTQDDLLGALRHCRNAATQIVQALTARKLEEKNRG